MFPILLDDSSLHEVRICRTFEKENGVCIDLDDLGKEWGFVESDNRLRSLFDEALGAFFSERSATMCFRPIPTSSDGKNIDLFKLFWVVRKIGGYDMVSSNYLWSFVVKHCGLASQLTAFCKLIYIKYLKDFDEWLLNFNKRCNLDIQSGTCTRLDLLVHELKSKIEEFPNESNKGSLTSRKRGIEEIININDVHDGFCALGNDNIMVLAKNDLDQGVDSEKSKRESFSFKNLLEWTKDVAKRSDDPLIGKIPKSCNFENHAWLFALVVRKVRFRNEVSRSSDNASRLQRKPWTNVPTSNVQTRISHTFCNECIGSEVQATFCEHTESENKGKKSGPKRNKESTEENKGKARKGKNVSEREDGIEYILSYKSKTNDIMIGSEYQAEVPEWTGKIYESDSKWLGTIISSPEEEEEEKKPSMSLVPVGRGRQESSCGCEWKNSTECVRFHVAEKRFLLRIELGSLFFKWRFDRMGEEVSLSWTPEEEDKFKKVVTSNATDLWKNLARMFPSKTREMLVSYYFNVYINQVRSYQNRTTLKEIDSDCEEEQGETIVERFGYRALEAPNSSPQLLCIENKQSFEFQ